MRGFISKMWCARCILWIDVKVFVTRLSQFWLDVIPAWKVWIKESTKKLSPFDCDCVYQLNLTFSAAECLLSCLLPMKRKKKLELCICRVKIHTYTFFRLGMTKWPKTYSNSFCFSFFTCIKTGDARWHSW